ncbi:hypothetical protein J421_1909 [Gemmatirosa kalamazoonensis]|uniref:Uncharacterized protein n=1 Tax=Gemmatirosa kalamazoonensis TaxID=861299 RepID=W0RF73_9BACT|nr:hypothetical protein [Gemmatirosa kalamazoonensis]AHG89446.1 hypothetical protein J421_1909 [Gemmatirosa kalamazoonensis]
MDVRGEEFSFIDAGRTFRCRIENSRTRAGDAWWWFEVSTEQYERHAPFRAEASDTPAGVRARVVAYYDDLLARRAAPAQGRWHQRPRVAPAATQSVNPTPVT